jgi:hypothetical protein
MEGDMKAPHPFAEKSWRQVANELTWEQFRDAILDTDCLQTVNIPWWKEQYEKLRDKE